MMLNLLRTHPATQPNQKYRTPDNATGSDFTIAANTSSGITIQTSGQNLLDIEWEKFLEAIRFLLNTGYGKAMPVGASYTHTKRTGVSLAVEPNPSDIVHTQYILPILQGVGLVKIHGSRPNKVELI